MKQFPREILVKSKGITVTSLTGLRKTQTRTEGAKAQDDQKISKIDPISLSKKNRLNKLIEIQRKTTRHSRNVECLRAILVLSMIVLMILGPFWIAGIL